MRNDEEKAEIVVARTAADYYLYFFIYLDDGLDNITSNKQLKAFIRKVF